MTIHYYQFFLTKHLKKKYNFANWFFVYLPRDYDFFTADNCNIRNKLTKNESIGEIKFLTAFLIE